MTADADALARRIAAALIRLLPTADWTEGLAGKVAGALGAGFAAQAATAASQLSADRAALGDAGPQQRDGVEAELYGQWRRRLELVLAADPDPLPRAEAVLVVLQAATGVRSGDWGHSPPQREPGDGQRQRRLRCECPATVQVGADFGVIVRIAVAGDGVKLSSFPVPPGGRDVVVDVRAPGLLVRGPFQQQVRVPPDSDSPPVRFELRASQPGLLRISVTAWLDGNFLGEVVTEVMASRQSAPADRQDASSDLSAEIADGAVSLLVRHEPRDNLYRFQFMDIDNPREVLAPLHWPLGPQLDLLIARLEATASGADNFSRSEMKNRLIDEGAELWRALVPEAIRRQFWDRRDRITHLKILGENDRVPWELTYPMDAGLDAGFLVEQFPVTRDVFERPGLARTLRPHPARFVLPEGSPRAAHREIEFLSRLLDAGSADNAVISRFGPLRELISGGGFGLLHFACHNYFDGAEGSTINLGDAPFSVTNLQAARTNKALEPFAPLVFLNACRSAEGAPRYNELAGWAETFLRAGAGAFIGSLWAVRDRSAFTFAKHFYEILSGGKTLGEAAMAARQAIAGNGADPTWLAYAIYGDPNARIAQPLPR